jgi:mRNA degradation ribonuclease J1/J2
VHGEYRHCTHKELAERAGVPATHLLLGIGDVLELTESGESSPRSRRQGVRRRLDRRRGGRLRDRQRLSDDGSSSPP